MFCLTVEPIPDSVSLCKCTLNMLQRKMNVLLVIIHYLCIFGVHGYSLNDSITLMNDMLRNYDGRNRPIENQSMPIQVSTCMKVVYRIQNIQSNISLDLL